MYGHGARAPKPSHRQVTLVYVQVRLCSFAVLLYVCNNFDDAADIRTLEMWRRKPDPFSANLGKLRGTNDDLRAPKLCLQIEMFGALP